MRKHVVKLLLVALPVLLGGGAAIADHFDGNAETGSFDPQLAVTVSNTVVDRPSTVEFRITQQDHEDPPVLSYLRWPGDWQFGFASTDPAKKPDGVTPATRCEDALDNHGNSPNGTGWGAQIDYSKRSDATVARAEKIGNLHLKVHATGFTRPGSPAEWNGKLYFLSYDAVASSARLCGLLITTDTRVTSIPDTNPDPGDNEDDIESVTELVFEFAMTRTATSWEVVADLRETVKDPIFQAPSAENPPSPTNPAGVDLSLLEFRADILGTSEGNWNAGGAVAFSRASHVSGAKTFEGEFHTCPADDPTYGGCVSGRPPVTRTFTRTVTLPAPAITQPAPGATDNDGAIVVGGTADALATVQLYENNIAVGAPVAADGTGVWSGTFNFAEGPHTIVARTFDAGGESADSNARAFTIDLPPSAPIVSSPAPGEIVGAGAITVSGTAQPGSTVKLYEGGPALSSTTAQAPSGAWSTTVMITGKGPHTLTATATDAGGESVATPFTFDVTTAVPLIVTPAEGGAFPVNSVTVSGTAESGATVAVFENGVQIDSAVADLNGDWSLTRSFDEGAHALTATATGLDLLVSPPSPVRNFAVDLTAPGAPVITSPLENAEVGSATLAVGGTSEPNATIILSEGGSSFATGLADANGNWSIPAQLSVATHTVVAVARDAAGNLSPPSDPRTFVVVQSILINTPAENSFQPRAVTVSGLSDPSSTQVLIYEGATQRASAAVSNGAWSVNVFFPTDGTHTITARAVTGGVVSPPSVPRTFKVDGTVPVLTVSNPSASDGIGIMLPGDAISGSALDSGSGVKSIAISYFNAAGQFVRGQSAVCTGCTGGSVTWSAIPSVSPGVYGVRIRAIDAVGNGSELAQLTVVIL